MRIYPHSVERPSVSTALCAQAHEWFVGRLDVQAGPSRRLGIAKVKDQLPQQKSVQKQSVQLEKAQLQVQGINGPTAKATGMAKPSASAGVGASGVPPRGRPV